MTSAQRVGCLFSANRPWCGGLRQRKSRSACPSLALLGGATALGLGGPGRIRSVQWVAWYDEQCSLRQSLSNQRAIPNYCFGNCFLISSGMSNTIGMMIVFPNGSIFNDAFSVGFAEGSCGS